MIEVFMNSMFFKTQKNIIAFVVFFIAHSMLNAQDVKVTPISNDVIILHPSGVKNLEIIREVGGTVTAICTDSGIIVFDSFVSFEAAQMARELIIEYFPNKPFKYLICSHHHADHIRGNQYFKNACIIGHKNVEKYMMAEYDRLIRKYGNYNLQIDSLENLLKDKIHKSIEKEKIKEDLAFWKDTKSFFDTYVPTPPSIQISSDIIFKLGDKKFEILFFGKAHTDNDIVLLDRDDRVLVMGDLLCYQKCYVLGSESDAKNWIALLDVLIARQNEYDYVIPGHGGTVEKVDALIEQRDYLKNICNAVESARQNNLTLDEAKKINQLEQYKTYLMYDRIGRDMEAYWQQLEKLKGNE